MFESTLVLVSILFIVTVGIAIECYKQLGKARGEYENAREVVEDIVSSFNRQLKQEADRLELVGYKVEAVSSKSDKALSKAQEAAKTVQDLEGRFGSFLEDKERLLLRLDESDKKVRDVATLQEALAARTSAIEEQNRQFSMFPEAKIEPVIPIRRDRVLAPLTETELSVLEMLSLQGPKTAPEIKERIKLSREHTARLMKKLYEEGYLERESNKIPFKYSVKKEMQKLLKKPESEVE